MAMTLRGVNQLVLWAFYNEELIRQNFILPVTTLGLDMTQPYWS